MTRILQLVLISILSGHFSHGQIFKNVGFKAGINYSKFRWDFRANSTTGDGSLVTNRTVGYNYFITSDILTSDIFDINSSLGYVQKNGITTFAIAYPGRGPYRGETPYKLDYISWINTIRGKLPLSNTFFLTGQAGPRVEYLASYSDEMDSFVHGQGFFYAYEDGDINRFHIGLSYGLGLMFQFRGIDIGVEGWKNLNFHPIASAKGPRRDGLGDEGFYLKMRDRTYMLNVVCIFEF